MNYFMVIFMVMLGIAQASPMKDVRYSDEHERCVLDVYPAFDTEGVTPVYVFFHGGGFTHGDKKQIAGWHAKSLAQFRSAGFTVISCNYPFLGQKMNHREIVGHCARAIQFIRSKAREWKVDPEKLVCGGVSAGALISEFLAYHDDFQKKSSQDKVEQWSSRPQVVLSMMQPIGTQQFALRYMNEGEAPIFIHASTGEDDRLHPPAEATKIFKKAKRLNIPASLYGSPQNDLPPLPEGRSFIDAQIAFINEHLK